MTTEFDATPEALPETTEVESQEVVQETAAGQPESKPVADLTQDPNFRKWQSQYDRKFKEVTDQLAAFQQRAWEAEQRTHQQAMQNMTREEALAYQNQLLQQEIAAERQRRQQEQWAWTKEQGLREIASIKGISYDELVEALPPGSDSHTSWKVAEELIKQKASPGAAKKEQVRSATENNVHVASPNSKSVQSDLQARLNKARSDSDVGAILDIQEEMKQRGMKWV